MNKISLVFMIALLQGVTAQAREPFKVSVVTTPDAGFYVNSVIIEGKNETMIVDAQLSKSGALKVLSQSKTNGKPLTTIYITHAHPDHYLALSVFKEAFPKVKILAIPEVAEEIRKNYKPKLDKWIGILGKDAASSTVDIEEISEKFLKFNGSKLEIIRHIQGDQPHSTMLWLPEERIMIAGDVVFDDMHVYTPETDIAARRKWIQTLADIKARHPKIVVPGHNKVGAPLNGTTAINFTEKYLIAFDEELAKASDVESLIAKMKSRYPTAELGFSIERSAAANIAIKKQNEKKSDRDGK